MIFRPNNDMLYYLDHLMKQNQNVWMYNWERLGNLHAWECTSLKPILPLAVLPLYFSKYFLQEIVYHQMQESIQN